MTCLSFHFGKAVLYTFFSVLLSSQTRLSFFRITATMSSNIRFTAALIAAVAGLGVAAPAPWGGNGWGQGQGQGQGQGSTTTLVNTYVQTTTAAQEVPTTTAYDNTVVTTAAGSTETGAYTAPAGTTTPAESAAPYTASSSSATGTYTASSPSSTGNSSSTGGSYPAGTKPGGRKAGSAGGTPAPLWEDALGWYYNWDATPPAIGDLETPSMLWGDGQNGANPADATRFSSFKSMSNTPKFVLGFNEPDLSGPNSAAMSVEDGVKYWNELIAPKGEAGALLGSPAMGSK